MEGKKTYLPMQVKYLMPESMYKVIDALVVFQKDGIMSYSKKMCEYLHMDESIVEQCIQTAIDMKLFTLAEKNGGIFKFKLNEDTIKKMNEIPLKDVNHIKLITLSTEIRFKNDHEEIKPSSNFDNMSEEDMKKMILMMQARLKEREEVKNIVRLASEPTDAPDDLPW